MRLRLKKIGFSLILILCLSGCGYKLFSVQSPSTPTVTSPDDRTCMIKEIITTNRTYLPGIEDKLRYILSEELLRRGCTLNTGQGITIYGTVTDLSMSVQAERSNQVALYEIILKIEFKVLMPEGKMVSKTMVSPFITDFRSGARIEDILLARDEEIDKSIRDISVELIETMLRAQK